MKPIDPRLIRRARSARAFMGATVAVGVATCAVVVAQAVLLASILAGVVVHREPLAHLQGRMLALAGVLAARALLVWVTDVVAARSSAAVKSELRLGLLRSVVSLPPGRLASERAGQVAVLAGRGLDGIDAYFATYVPQLVLASLVPLVILGCVSLADWRSALILAVTLPLIPVFMVLIGLATRERTEQQWQAVSRLGAHFLDVVEGLPTLRVFGRARRQAEVLRDLADEHRRATMDTLRVAFVSSLVLELLTTLGTALVAVTIGLRLLDGHVSLGTAFVVLLLAPEAYLPLRQVGAAFHASMDGVTAVQSAIDLIEEGEAAEVDAVRPGAALPDLRHAAITFDAVTFTWPGRDQPVLDQASFVVHPGEHVALVGPSGAGKSTLLTLLLRSVHPDAGAISVGDTDLRDLDAEEWRAAVTWVPQRPHLFAASVADNVRLGMPQATDAEVWEALTRADAVDAVNRLPDGLATRIGDGGVALSAGERQRVALARAFLRDTPVVLLDEPTSNLDASTQERVLDAVDRLAVGRTVITVSHRAAVSLRADRTIELVGGRVTDGHASFPAPIDSDRGTGAGVAGTETASDRFAAIGPFPATATERHLVSSEAPL